MAISFGSSSGSPFKSRVYDALGWCMMFASTGIIGTQLVAAGGLLTLLSLPIILGALAVTMLGIGFFALATREDRKLEAANKEKTIKVEVAQGQKSVTLDLNFEAPARGTGTRPVIGEHTQKLADESGPKKAQYSGPSV